MFEIKAEGLEARFFGGVSTVVDNAYASENSKRDDDDSVSYHLSNNNIWFSLSKYLGIGAGTA